MDESRLTPSMWKALVFSGSQTSLADYCHKSWGLDLELPVAYLQFFKIEVDFSTALDVLANQHSTNTVFKSNYKHSNGVYIEASTKEYYVYKWDIDVCMSVRTNVSV